MKIYQNKQEVFDAVWVHINQQRVACVDSEGTCVYYDKVTGNSCAIGGIFSEEIDAGLLTKELKGFNSGIEDVLVEHNSFQCQLVQELFQNISVVFLRRLQQAHDGPLNETSFEAWVKRMVEIAELYGLKVPENVPHVE